MKLPEPSGPKPESSAPEAQSVVRFLSWHRLNRAQRSKLLCGLGFTALLVLVFWRQFIGLIIHSAGADLHSHILLVPFISAYLLFLQRHELPKKYCSSPASAVALLVAGLVVWAVGWSLCGSGSLSRNDSLALSTLSLLLGLAGGGFLFLGRQWMVDAAFPVAFLIFMIPLPDFAVNWLETASKLASAEAADWFFTMSRTPVLRDRTMFQLPGMVIEVAQECSGIRSSWVLFITSLVASHLFLKSPWRRLLLVALVIPLGILRNGFRIMVIGLLCVHVGPHMIHSPIHHQGGPLFFVLSLFPLFILLWWLRRGEARRIPPAAPTDAPLPGAPAR